MYLLQIVLLPLTKVIKKLNSEKEGLGRVEQLGLIIERKMVVSSV